MKKNKYTTIHFHYCQHNILPCGVKAIPFVAKMCPSSVFEYFNPYLSNQFAYHHDR